MSTLYREPSIDGSYQVSVHLSNDNSSHAVIIDCRPPQLWHLSCCLGYVSINNESGYSVTVTHVNNTRLYTSISEGFLTCAFSPKASNLNVESKQNRLCDVSEKIIEYSIHFVLVGTSQSSVDSICYVSSCITGIIKTHLS